MPRKITPEDLIDSAIRILQSNRYFDAKTQEDNQRIVDIILKRVKEMVSDGTNQTR